MNLSVLNLAMLINLVVCSLPFRAKRNIPWREILFALTLVGIGLVSYFKGLELESPLGIGIATGTLYYSFQMFSVSPAKKDDPYEGLFFGYWLLLLNTSNFFFFLIYLVLGEVFMSSKTLRSESRPLGTAFLKFQYWSSMKLFLLIMLLVFGTISLPSMDLGQTALLNGSYMFVVPGFLALLSSVYAGFFDTKKEIIRLETRLTEENFVLIGLINRCLAPGILMIKAKEIMALASYDDFLFSLKCFCVFFSVLLLLSIRQTIGKKQASALAYFQYYFLAISISFFFIEKINSFDYLTVISVFYIVLALLSFHRFEDKLKKSLLRLTLPTPVSPVFWGLFFAIALYQGPLKVFYAFFAFLSLFSGAIAFCFQSQGQDSLLKTNAFSRKASSIILGATIVFVSILFVVKMLI